MKRVNTFRGILISSAICGRASDLATHIADYHDLPRGAADQEETIYNRIEDCIDQLGEFILELKEDINKPK